MNKLSLKDLKNNIDWEVAVIVFTVDSCKEPLSEVERSYKIKRDNKYFYKHMSGSSLYGDCLDGTERFIELTQYFGDGDVNVDYCYIIK